MKTDTTPFPVIASTLSAQEIGNFIARAYSFKGNVTCKLYRTGINHTYFLSSDDANYVVRVYSHNWRSKAEIAEEINLLELLKNNDIRVSFPIPDKNEEYIQEIYAPEGLRYAVVFSFGEGGKVRFMSESTCFAIGAMMAKMHRVTAGKKMNRTTYNPESLLYSSYEYIKSFFSEQLEEMQFIKEINKKISDTFQSITLADHQKGIVHLDIWYDNMSVLHEDEITLFDFDNCGNGWLILDVAYFCKQLFHIEMDKIIYEQKRNSFLKGYQTYRSLTDEELALIPECGAAIYIHYLGIQAKRFDWSNIFLTENYLKMYIGRIKDWIEYNHR